MLAGGQLKTAEIRLTPAELGPLKIQVVIEDGTANVSFQSQHAVTRDAIEQALPRLRELLAENGLTLGQSSGSEQDLGKENQHHADTPMRPIMAGTDASISTAEDSSAASVLRTANGLIDTFV
jgi:flagellar hook-length control protein FliK